MAKKIIYLIVFTIIAFLSINICNCNKVCASTVDEVMEGANDFIEMGRRLICRIQ